MKILGIFRGFPGLGRVVAGTALLKSLQNKYHCDVKAFTYLQGRELLHENQIEEIPVRMPENDHIMILGLNPIGHTGEDICRYIIQEKPDLLILDGEPLLTRCISQIYDRNRIICLLNPHDIINHSLPQSSMFFYHDHYLSAGHAIVHGINLSEELIPKQNNHCQIYITNTILRNEIFKIQCRKNAIIGILGGGTRRASSSFFDSTVKMGLRIAECAVLMPNEKFILYCNDDEVKKAIETNCKADNLEIIAQFTQPDEIYNNAKVVICRAGRNTVSEILFLKLPAVLISTSGDFRSAEQDKNIDSMCRFSNGLIQKYHFTESAQELKQKLVSLIQCGNTDAVDFVPGNKNVLKIIDAILEENANDK